MHLSDGGIREAVGQHGAPGAWGAGSLARREPGAPGAWDAGSMGRREHGTPGAWGAGARGQLVTSAEVKRAQANEQKSSA